MLPLLHGNFSSLFFWQYSIHSKNYWHHIEPSSYAILFNRANQLPWQSQSLKNRRIYFIRWNSGLMKHCGMANLIRLDANWTNKELPEIPIICPLPYLSCKIIFPTSIYKLRSFFSLVRSNFLSLDESEEDFISFLLITSLQMDSFDTLATRVGCFSIYFWCYFCRCRFLNSSSVTGSYISQRVQKVHFLPRRRHICVLKSTSLHLPQ